MYFGCFFLVHPLFVCLSIYPMYLSQRFGSVLFFTDPDPDPTQKPKADPDPGKSTPNCVKRIIDKKNVRILPLGHNQISAVICRQ